MQGRVHNSRWNPSARHDLSIRALVAVVVLWATCHPVWIRSSKVVAASTVRHGLFVRQAAGGPGRDGGHTVPFKSWSLATWATGSPTSSDAACAAALAVPATICNCSQGACR